MPADIAEADFIVVGAGSHGRGVVARLRASPWSGLAVRAYYDDDPRLIGTVVDGVPVHGPLDRLAADLRSESADQVWIALPLRTEGRIRQCVDDLRATPAVIRFVPDIYSFHLLNHSITEIAGMPVLNLTDTPLTEVRATWKAVEDFALGSVLLVAALPLIVLIAIGIKLSSRGPVIYAAFWRSSRNCHHARAPSAAALVTCAGLAAVAASALAVQSGSSLSWNTLSSGGTYGPWPSAW